MAYTDASVKGKKASLAFLIVFEDKSIVRRRVVVDESNNNIAEALAFAELVSFLKYYNITKGIILFDSDYVKSRLKKKNKRLRRRGEKRTLSTQQIRTQLIPRKINVAHSLSYEDKFVISNPISTINRSYYHRVPAYPEYLMQLSVLDEYRQLYNKRFATFHDVQMNLNKKIWLADLDEEIGDIKIFEIQDKRIVVYRDTIIKLSRANYVRISNHWRVIRRRRKLKRLLNM
ncbi:hypothetical protein ACN6MY_10895 [Peribacillus sp. B-H-3]|uniref:hypothetical protein n=1 Tax=Peribacillus sp. B-H-3 TaxID=3400420 RepID=UPI003B017170